MPLVFSHDFENLPAEPKLRWLKLRDLLEKRLDETTSYSNGPSDDDLVEYCAVLSSAAEELKLADFVEPSLGNIRESYHSLRSAYISLATKLSIQVAPVNLNDSVFIQRKQKLKIEAQIARLRKMISESDFDRADQERLQSKLDELIALIRAPRSDFGQVFRVIAYLAMFLGGATSFLADAPDAISTISALIGEAKEEEEEEQRLLEPNVSPLAIADHRVRDSDSDEIPF